MSPLLRHRLVAVALGVGATVCLAVCAYLGYGALTAPHQHPELRVMLALAVCCYLRTFWLLADRMERL